MDKDNFTISFHGDAVKDGEMEAQDLAIALISMSELVQIANREANGEQAQISIKISETKKGSFEALLQIILENDALLTYGVTFLKEALARFINLAKWLRGRKIDKTEFKDGQIHIHIGDDNTIITPIVRVLLEDTNARNAIKQLASILDEHKTNKIKLKLNEDDEPLEIDVSEISFFDLPDDDEDLLETTREVALQIENLSFKSTNKWRVNDGQSSFYVMIEDEDFLRRVENSRISFSNGDTLICIIREHQLAEDPTSKKECSIIKVLKHHSSAKQLGLL